MADDQAQQGPGEGNVTRKHRLPAAIRAMRPHQWVKNLFVIAPLVFAKGLLDQEMVLRTVGAFFTFSFAASSIYILNDLSDVEADRAHPKKRFRAIASGAIGEGAALRLGLFLALLALGMSFALGPWVLATILGYLILQYAYTNKLKHIAYVDVLCIALGFELRVLCGANAARVDPSDYLILVTALLATYLGFGKRMHELMQGVSAEKQRKVLKHYSKSALVALLVLTGLATVGVYAMYTLDPHTRETFKTDYLIGTTLFTAFGVFRFLHLVRSRPESESPTEEMLRDKPFLLNLVLWAVAVVVIIYLGWS